MKKILIVAILSAFAINSNAHSINVQDLASRSWHLEGGQDIEGSFPFFQNNTVFLERGNSTVVQYPLSSFSASDQHWILKRYEQIKTINESHITRPIQTMYISPERLIFILAGLLVIGLLLYTFPPKTKVKYLPYIMVSGILAMLYSFKNGTLQKTTITTDPTSIDSSFIPFKPNVVTSWDGTYFYIESQGIPSTHGMMVGISDSGWQQQVPIPQCYILPNAWSIPLHPTMASSPIPVDSVHFTRGAIAIAVNGVPIFNEHTNTGADALTAGQLDNYGGHCGRADDYHYHVAPLHLYGHTASTLPIAWAFDGFAVYGALEPDGSTMTALDINHGHYGSNGIYHYHGTSSYPYMIARMAGNVTEDATHQLIPQATASPVRPGQTPLSGALITSCMAVGTNGYVLTYTLAGQTYQVSYSWTASGVYTFNFINPTGTTTETYNGFIPCKLPVGISNITYTEDKINIYPNPSKGQICVMLKDGLKPAEIKNITVISANGQTITSLPSYTEHISIPSVGNQVYFIVIKTTNAVVTKKIITE